MYTNTVFLVKVFGLNQVLSLTISRRTVEQVAAQNVGELVAVATLKTDNFFRNSGATFRTSFECSFTTDEL